MADRNLKKGESGQHVLANFLLDVLKRQNLLTHQNQFNPVLEAHAKTEITAMEDEKTSKQRCVVQLQKMLASKFHVALVWPKL